MLVDISRQTNVIDSQILFAFPIQHTTVCAEQEMYSVQFTIIVTLRARFNLFWLRATNHMFMFAYRSIPICINAYLYRAGRMLLFVPRCSAADMFALMAKPAMLTPFTRIVFRVPITNGASPVMLTAMI